MREFFCTEVEDARDLKSLVSFSRAGSSPALGTPVTQEIIAFYIMFESFEFSILIP